MSEEEMNDKVKEYVRENFPEYWELHIKDPEEYPIYPELLKSLKHRYPKNNIGGK
jgi:hypothetical protein